MRADVIGPWIHGVVPIACIVAGLLCLGSWRNSGERLFVFFAVAFWVLGLNVTLLTMVYWGWL